MAERGDTPPHFDRLRWGGKWVRQLRRNVEDASGACCSGGVGMEVGKEQQVGARRNPAVVYLDHCGHNEATQRDRAAGKLGDGSLSRPLRKKQGHFTRRTRQNGLA